MLIRPIDIVRRPRRTLAYARREAGWLRRFARTIEDRGVPAFPPPTTEATDRLHAADGDHGIRNPEWGTAFFTTEWLLDEVVGRWSVVGYGPGRAEGNQDMVVLQRR